ncbi:MAG: sugar phosphate nucleotidyltransferase [Muribaculaceae bacterium]
MNINDYIISNHSTVLEALQRLNNLPGTAMTLFVCNPDGTLLGSLTDGDIRRSLIAGHQLTDNVDSIMHHPCVAFHGTKVNVADVKQLRSKRITLVPHINDSGKIVNIYNFNHLHSLLPIDAVLMAGGKGERLRPLTLDTPKPLLKIGDRCIIDYNIEALARNGISHISVTTNYLAEKIEEHFAQPLAGVKVNCVKEPYRMGTIGSLTLIKEFHNDTILLMNSDLLTSLCFEDFYMAHVDDDADMTVASVPYMVSVPYGIFVLDGNRILDVEEKPTYNYYANAGIYLIKRQWLDIIPRGEYFDATHFMEAMIKKGGKVTHFPIEGTWIDIGSPSDFKHAQDLMKHRKSLSQI